ncbi:MAG: M48 family metalloprotease [Candidatus Omnitrophica bacterium]|nr:M48 family metalloprotease [Candidatus Omnitrophota bacterium]
MVKKIINILFIVSFFAYLAGCVTLTGPAVSQEEIKKTQEELKVKALDYQIKQLQRLQNIGHRLMLAIPKEDINQPPQPLLGIMCFNVDEHLQKLYNLNMDKAVVVVVVKEPSPASEVGIKPGDVLLSINNTKINNLHQFANVVDNLKIGDRLQIKVLRDQQYLSFETKIASIPVNLPIIIVDLQEVNAATDGRAIFVTYGLLNFAKSDDEIAAVLAHELAHAVRRHVTKAQGTQILSFLAALALGIAVESNAPGSGEAVMRGVNQIGEIFNAHYSRDLEREADYFGTRFVYYAGYDVEACATVEERFAIEIPASMVKNFLSTHPSSPERVTRIRKTIEELKAKELKERKE